MANQTIILDENISPFFAEHFAIEFCRLQLDLLGHDEDMVEVEACMVKAYKATCEWIVRHNARGRA